MPKSDILPVADKVREHQLTVSPFSCHRCNLSLAVSVRVVTESDCPADRIGFVYHCQLWQKRTGVLVWLPRHGTCRPFSRIVQDSPCHVNHLCTKHLAHEITILLMSVSRKNSDRFGEFNFICKRFVICVLWLAFYLLYLCTRYSCQVILLLPSLA